MEKELANFDDHRHITKATADTIYDKFLAQEPLEIDGRRYFVRSFAKLKPAFGADKFRYELEEIK